MKFLVLTLLFSPVFSSDKINLFSEYTNPVKRLYQKYLWSKYSKKMRINYRNFSNDAPIFENFGEKVKKSESLQVQALIEFDPSEKYLEGKTYNEFESLVELENVKLNQVLLSKLFTPKVNKIFKEIGTEVVKKFNGNYLFKSMEGRTFEISQKNLRFINLRYQGTYTLDRFLYNKIRKLLLEEDLSQLSSKEIQLLFENISYFSGGPEHLPKNLKKLAQNVSAKLPKMKREKSIDNETILIISTRGGGGHETQAFAIADYLKEIGRNVEIVYVEELIQDPLSELTNGKYCSNSRWNVIHQKRKSLSGNTLSKKEMYEQWALISHIIYTFRAVSQTKNVTETLYDMLKDPKYVLVIDNLPHWKNIESSSISHGIPHIRWVTDYDIWKGIEASFKKYHPSYGRIAISSLDPRANRKLGLTSFFNDKESFVESVKKDSRIFPAGYPIRSGIKKLSQDEKIILRDQYQIDKDTFTILVMMGSQGKKELVDIVDELAKNPVDNMKIIVGVGNNFSIKNQIKNIGKGIELVFADELFGVPGKYLDEHMINSALNMSDLLVSKPGGSQTTEVFEVEIPILMYALNDGEVENADLLKRSGLGFKANFKRSIPTKVKKIRKKIKSIRLNEDFKPINWRNSIQAMLKEFGV